MEKQTFLKGILVLVVGSIIAKALGAVYRIPLTWILGAEGLGVYQLVFPVFSLLLVLSSTAVPTALSKIIASENSEVNCKKILRVSIVALFIVGFIFSVVLFALSGVIANFQGNPKATLPYMAIAPSLVIVSVISAFRGYFQGKLNMTPTAVSNIVEQLFKLIFGLTLSFLLIPQGLEFGVLGAVLGVTLSEFVTLGLLTITYLVEKKKGSIHNEKITISTKQVLKNLAKTAFPIIVANIILPISLFLDSLLVVNILLSSGFTASQSTILWGLDSGVVTSIINLPVVFTLQVATCIVPNLTSDRSQISKRVNQSFLISCAISIPCALAVFVLAPQILSVLYSGTFSSTVIDEMGVATKLLSYSSGLIILTAILQTQNATLQGLGHLKIPVINMSLAVILKLVFVFTLIQNPELNIFGLMIAKYVFFATVVCLNTIYMVRKGYKINRMKEIFVSLLSSISMAMTILVTKNFITGFSPIIGLLVLICVGVIVYSVNFLCLLPEKNYLRLIKFRKRSL